MDEEANIGNSIPRLALRYLTECVYFETVDQNIRMTSPMLSSLERSHLAPSPRSREIGRCTAQEAIQQYGNNIGERGINFDS